MYLTFYGDLQYDFKQMFQLKGVGPFGGPSTLFLVLYTDPLT